ncbi:MAG: hypothetical protein KAQ68_00265 [Clostridiales bacterium]|nr:hypothetical protein [Clostridiales bacterium]
MIGTTGAQSIAPHKQSKKRYMMKKYLLILMVIAFLLSGCTEAIDQNTQQQSYDKATQEATQQKETTTKQDNAVQVPISENSLSVDSIQYLGAFRLPDDGNTEQTMFSYGGEALCYNMQNNSLFIAGHNWYTYIAEITIPEPNLTTDINQLNQAEVITPFTDIKGDLFDDWSMEIPRVGLEVLDDQLFFCFGQHYEDDTPRTTHGATNTTLDTASTVCQVSDYPYATNDYLFKIPSKFKASFGGNDLLTGRFRDGGWSGMGPGLFAVSSEDIMSSSNGDMINAVPLINYDTSYEGDAGNKMDNYSHADSITGGAFVSCKAGDSIVFTATHGFGDTWYGFSNGVVYPIDGDDNTVYPDVPAYPHDDRGWWNDDFAAALIMYDLVQLAMVQDGTLDANIVQPYAIVNLSEFMLTYRDETDMHHLGGCAYDIENNRLYVLELFADEDKPVVHVFSFGLI